MLFSKSNHLNLFDEILKLNYLSEIESHSEFKFTTFLGDSESDSYDNLGFSKSLGFDKVFIPLNSRNKNNSINSDLKFNTNGIQLCPLNKRPFKPEGRCISKNRSEH